MCTNHEQPSRFSRVLRRMLVLCIATISLNATMASIAHAEAGGIALGEARDGVTDRAYVLAPPAFRYEVARAPGSFVDCGQGLEARQTDAAGRDITSLTCSVTLTETIVIPAAARSARLIIHY